MKFIISALALVATVSTSAAGEEPAVFAADIFSKAIAATGGWEAYARLREVELTRTIASGDSGAIPMQFRQLVTLPAVLEVSSKTDDAFVASSIDGWEAHQGPTTDQAAAPADASTATALRSYLWREWWYLFARYRWHGLGETFVEALQPVWENGQELQVLSVEPRDATRFRLYIDAETGLPVKREFQDGDAEITDRFDDFRAVGGLKLPFHVTSWRNGVQTEDIRYLDYRLHFAELGDDPLAARIDAIVTASMREKHIPGLTLVVLKNGDTFYQRAYGDENVELNLPARMETVYPLASVSKMFAAIAAMQLVESGRLRLEAAISEYLPNIPTAYANVTVSNLLEHTHGIADPEGARDRPAAQDPGIALAESANPKTFDDLLADALSAAPSFEPSERFRYSVFGYHILQNIIERVSGANYESFVMEHILAPAGMSTARFGGSERIVPGRHPVDYRWRDGRLIYNALVYPEAGYASAGLNASALDMAKLFAALRDNRLISAAAKQRMWRESRLIDGTPTNYALGWGSYRRWRDGRWVVGHSGGGSSWVRHFPELDLTVIALSNLNGARADGLAHDIADAVIQLSGK